MDYDTYGSNAVELAIDLANADRSEPEWAGDFLRAHDEWFTTASSLDLTEAESGQVADVAVLIRAVALAGTQADVIARLNELLALAHPQPYATDHDGDLHLHYAGPDSPALEQLTTTVAMGLSSVVAQHGWQRLGRLLGRGLRQRLRRHQPQRQPPLLLEHLRQPLDRRRLPRPPEVLTRHPAPG